MDMIAGGSSFLPNSCIPPHAIHPSCIDLALAVALFNYDSIIFTNELANFFAVSIAIIACREILSTSIVRT